MTVEYRKFFTLMVVQVCIIFRKNEKLSILKPVPKNCLYIKHTHTHEVPVANLGPLSALQRNTCRMDLIITYSNLQPTLADVTVAHPSPSNQASITAAMSCLLFFAAKIEGKKQISYSSHKH